MVVKVTWKRVVLALAALAVTGLAIAWSGVINIGASTGHAAITDVALHWAMRKSVRTWAALAVDPPAAASSSELVSAAGHYASNCAFCHGAPGVEPAVVMRAATPSAPDLALTANEWTDAQLHWIVKHGVKFTAMPAWPAQDRDDEVRRMTAFVRQLPQMSPEEYRRLAYGAGRLGGMDLASVEEALPDCERCHAEDGRGQGDIPALAGQKAEYLSATLRAYARGTRRSGVMSAVAARLDARTMQALADHYSREPSRLVALSNEMGSTSPSSSSSDVSTAEAYSDRRMQEIVERGLPEANLPACGKCHGRGRRASYPLVGGQKATYMAERLRRWRGEPHVVDARKPNESMPMIARRIPEELVEPLASYLERASSRQGVTLSDERGDAQARAGVEASP